MVLKSLPCNKKMNILLPGDEMEAMIAEAESGLNKDVRTGIFE